MRVGIAPLFQYVDDLDRFEAMRRGEGVSRPDDARIMREQFSLGDLAEPLGFDSLWTFEHHASPYILLPNPQQYIAYFAGRTTRIDFGTMVTVMPWHHPVRLAENLALLQHMMGPGRRLFLGLGRGLARREYDSLNIHMDESRPRMAEGLEIVRRALHAEQFEFEGEIYRFPRSSVRPSPLDTRVIDDAYGVWTSEASMEVTAQLGLSPLTIPSKSLAAYAEELKQFDAMRASAGFGPASRPIVQVFLFCHESEQEAAEKAEEYLLEYAKTVTHHYELGGDHFKTLRSYASYVTGSGANTDFAKADQDVNDGATNISKVLQGDAIIGTPEQCYERMVAINDVMQPREVVLVCSPGSMPVEESTSSLKLFAERALPKVKKLASGRVSASTDP